MDYLKQLHDRHEQWLFSPSDSLKIPVLTVDANQAKDNVYTDTNSYLGKLVVC